MADLQPADGPSRRKRAAAAINRLDPITGAPERAVFGILGYFLPDTAVVRRPKFQHLLAAKFFADAGRDSVRYASLVGVIYLGGGAFASSLIGIAALIPGVIFALYGGAISDSIPKRLALAFVYLVDAALCLSVALFFEDTIAVYFMLVFLVTSLTQIASPAEQTLVPLVNSEAQLATANSVMGMVSSIGTAVGTAFIAPILLKVSGGTNAVFIACAVLLLLAMTRILQADSPNDVAAGKLVRPNNDFGAVYRWLFSHRSIATMVGVSAVGGMGYTIVSTLAPTFVADVLETDPANTVFVMGVAGAGMTVSLFAVPPMIKRVGERVTAGIGFLLLSVGLVLLGMINREWLNFLLPINPVHWIVSLFNLEVNEKIQMAMFISFPIGFGMGLTDNSVKTYLNRRVPVAYQGRTFAIRNLSESALTILPLLALSAVAAWTGVSFILFLMPAIFYVVILILLHLSTRFGSELPPEDSGVFKTYWEASDEEQVASMGDYVREAPPAP